MVRAVTVGFMSLTFNLNRSRIVGNYYLHFPFQSISVVTMAAFLFNFNGMLDVEKIDLFLQNT